MKLLSRFGVQGLLQSSVLLLIFVGYLLLAAQGDGAPAGLVRVVGIVAAAAAVLLVVVVVAAAKRHDSNKFQKQYAKQHPDAMVFGSCGDKTLVAQVRPFMTYDQWSSLKSYFSVVGDSHGLKIFRTDTPSEPDISIPWRDVAGDVHPVRVQQERARFNGVRIPLNNPSLPAQLDLVVLGGGLGGIFAVSNSLTARISEELNHQRTP